MPRGPAAEPTQDDVGSSAGMVGPPAGIGGPPVGIFDLSANQALSRRAGRIQSAEYVFCRRQRMHHLRLGGAGGAPEWRSSFGSGRRWRIVTLQSGADKGSSDRHNRPTSDTGAVASSLPSAPIAKRQPWLPSSRTRPTTRHDGSERSHGSETASLLSLQASRGPRGRSGPAPRRPHRRRADAVRRVRTRRQPPARSFRTLSCGSPGPQNS
jgi:hypothetical protein